VSISNSGLVATQFNALQ